MEQHRQIVIRKHSSSSVPIEVPPGTNGVQPNLSLDYNSQQGNGLLGMGWNLSGLSAIVRCPKTLAIDGVVGGINFDRDDRFCVDGQRLMVVKGVYGADRSVYRTEKDTLIEYVSRGSAGSGPAYFTATAKDGSTMEYGVGDAQIKATHREDGAVRVWAIKKTTDRNGNYVTVEYTDDRETGE